MLHKLFYMHFYIKTMFIIWECFYRFDVNNYTKVCSMGATWHPADQHMLPSKHVTTKKLALPGQHLPDRDAHGDSAYCITTSLVL